MKFERLLLFAVMGLLALVCLKFPVWGIIALERKLDSYPIVSRDTIEIIDEMVGALEDFGKACETHQYGERRVQNFSLRSCEYEQSYRSCPYGDGEYEACLEWEQQNPVKSCTEQLNEIVAKVDEATHDMYAAVARRKAIAARAGFGLLKSMTLGTQAYTHSTWLCTPTYATFTTQINLGFTPTYEPAS